MQVTYPHSIGILNTHKDSTFDRGKFQIMTTMLYVFTYLFDDIVGNFCLKWYNDKNIGKYQLYLEVFKL